MRTKKIRMQKDVVEEKSTWLQTDLWEQRRRDVTSDAGDSGLDNWVGADVTFGKGLWRSSWWGQEIMVIIEIRLENIDLRATKKQEKIMDTLEKCGNERKWKLKRHRSNTDKSYTRILTIRLHLILSAVLLSAFVICFHSLFEINQGNFSCFPTSPSQSISWIQGLGIH